MPGVRPLELGGSRARSLEVRNPNMNVSAGGPLGGKLRAVAASSITAAIETFTPRRLLYSSGTAEPVDFVQRLVSAPVTLSRSGRVLLRELVGLPGLVQRVSALVDGAEAVLGRLERLIEGAESSIACLDAVRVDAAVQTGAICRLRERVDSIIVRCEPVLAAVADVDPALVRATAELLTELRPLFDRADDLVGPLMDELHDAIPDVRDILPVVKRLEPVLVDVETRIAGLPGSARLRRRGEHVIDKASDADA
jgi:hypothetical protein